MFLIPIPAFADNYQRLLHDGKRAVAVGPGHAGPEQRTLEKHALQSDSILVTHHRAAHNLDASVHDDITAFAAIRQWKNQYK